MLFYRQATFGGTSAKNLKGFAVSARCERKNALNSPPSDGPQKFRTPYSQPQTASSAVEMLGDPAMRDYCAER